MTSDHSANLDKTSSFIPGAGAIGMAILLISLSILFIASILAYMFIRSSTMAADLHPQWPPAGLPHAPSSLWYSTLVIILSAVTFQVALSAIRRDDAKNLRRFLGITFALACLFLLLQAFNWFEFYHAIPRGIQFQGAYLGMFYVLTGLHAVHVLGGLIPLAVVLRHALHNRYSQNFHPGVRYTCLYWHFLDIIWLILFYLIYF